MEVTKIDDNFITVKWNPNHPIRYMYLDLGVISSKDLNKSNPIEESEKIRLDESVNIIDEIV